MKPALQPWLRSLCLPMLLLFAAARLAAEPSLAPVTVMDDRGTEHRFASTPQRIVSLLPSLTELVSVLGAGPRLVGVDRYSNWPPEVRRLPQLGGMDDAQIETIATLRPDLVLASTSSRSIERLEALGFTIVRLRSESHADVQRTLLLLARLLGTPAAGAQVWARLQREIDAAAARVPTAVRGQRVYFEIGGGPYAAGTTSFIGETLARLGLANIVPAALGPFPKLNPEFVVRAQPELIMGPLREQAALVQRPGWGTLPAVRLQHLCGFDNERYEMLIRPGPRIGEAAHLLADCLVALPALR